MRKCANVQNVFTTYIYIYMRNVFTCKVLNVFTCEVLNVFSSSHVHTLTCSQSKQFEDTFLPLWACGGGHDFSEHLLHRLEEATPTHATHNRRLLE